jgi:hypothetical protein
VNEIINVTPALILYLIVGYSLVTFIFAWTISAQRAERRGYDRGINQMRSYYSHPSNR